MLIITLPMEAKFKIPNSKQKQKTVFILLLSPPTAGRRVHPWLKVFVFLSIVVNIPCDRSAELTAEASVAKICMLSLFFFVVLGGELFMIVGLPLRQSSNYSPQVMALRLTFVDNSIVGF
ncbi:hypothetical protein ACFL54_07145 [Planctomycetota bacterium]